MIYVDVRQGSSAQIGDFFYLWFYTSLPMLSHKKGWMASPYLFLFLGGKINFLEKRLLRRSSKVEAGVRSILESAGRPNH